jgi:hypothetical protein
MQYQKKGVSVRVHAQRWLMHVHKRNCTWMLSKGMPLNLLNVLATQQFSAENRDLASLSLAQKQADRTLGSRINCAQRMFSVDFVSIECSWWQTRRLYLMKTAEEQNSRGRRNHLPVSTKSALCHELWLLGLAAHIA